ncbi:MAG: DUF3078 domain-containing protein [Bacteroides sp.]|nr:DUF3078 domain-containing protein [Bacteroides sp.]MBD5347674.1 DUF3078 domain-containing protein [Bacteroides sp.]
MTDRGIRLTFSLLLLFIFGIFSIHADQPYLDSDPLPHDSLPVLDLSGEIYETPVNKSLFPRVFTGYRHISRRRPYSQFPDAGVVSEVMAEVWRDPVVTPDSVVLSDEDLQPDPDALSPVTPQPATTESSYEAEMPTREELSVAFGSVIPSWLRKSIDTYRFQEDFAYTMMIDNPSLIEYAYWDLPEPPRLPEEDYSFRGYLKRLNLPEIKPAANLPVHANGGRINWLHSFNVAIQLSQAYVSSNWYQGGTSHLAFFANTSWDVQLNQVYYPKAMFQSTVSYKLAINSTPDDQYHRYNVSQDLFQYNLKAGYKALENWYYSFTMQFKTQFFNSYPTNSPDRSASFLSPGEFNVGLGMTYSKQNEKKTLTFTASISPISYNLKTCIDKWVDHSQFGIRADRKLLNEIGSNAEVNFTALLWGNTTYTTRLFIFSDYKNMQTDWENTLNFQFSRLFSTQIYAHLRYDTSADSSISRKWRKLMMKEILSVGISYSFSTK